jgi:hypothetical protein
MGGRFRRAIAVPRLMLKFAVEDGMRARRCLALPSREAAGKIKGLQN